MQVDSSHHAFSLSPSLDDFLNLDLFAPGSSSFVQSSNSQQSSQSSPSPSSSPRTPLDPFHPLTPPSDALLAAFSSAPSGFALPPSELDAFFNFWPEDEAKAHFSTASGGTIAGSAEPFAFMPSHTGTGAASGMGAAPPYNVLSPFNTRGGSFSTPSSSASPGGVLAIDPQLVGTPSSVSQAQSDFEEDDGMGVDFDSDDDDDDEQVRAMEREEKEENLKIKVGGKGRGRKGTVASGGIVKRSGGASLVSSKELKDSAATSPAASTGGKSQALRILEPEDWRPSPEEYKKMSSKEKRQLRNKISARNFRVRRKEYITTLEGDIAERDRLISAIRTELGSSQSENVALRQEIDALKRALLTGRGAAQSGETVTGVVLPPPKELPEVSAGMAHQAAQQAAAQKDKEMQLLENFASPDSSSPASSAPDIGPNTQKDLPLSPRLSSRAFWGGFGGGLASMGGMGGITPVHTMHVPPIAVLGAKAGVERAERDKERGILQAQENINPALNGMSPASNGMTRGVERKGTFGMAPGANAAGAGVNGFDSWADVHPFNFKFLDAYRMQLWTKMAQQQQHSSHSSKQQPLTPPHSPPLNGLAGALRPHYFTPASGTKVPGSAVLAGKAGANTYPTPPASPVLAARTPSSPSMRDNEMPTREQQQHAVLAALASQTLLGKLGSAFWDAFSGTGSHTPGRVTANDTGRGLDAEKVRKVLEGKAVVRVVDVDSPPIPSTSSVAIMGMRGASPMRRESAGQKVQRQKEEAGCCLSDMLEESMRSLSLGKK